MVLEVSIVSSKDVTASRVKTRQSPDKNADVDRNKAGH